MERKRRRGESQGWDEQPECILKYMRIPSTAGTRDPERSRFFHKLSAEPPAKPTIPQARQKSGRTGMRNQSKPEGPDLCVAVEALKIRKLIDTAGIYGIQPQG